MDGTVIKICSFSHDTILYTVRSKYMSTEISMWIFVFNLFFRFEPSGPLYTIHSMTTILRSEAISIRQTQPDSLYCQDLEGQVHSVKSFQL